MSHDHDWTVLGIDHPLGCRDIAILSHPREVAKVIEEASRAAAAALRK